VNNEYQRLKTQLPANYANLVIKLCQSIYFDSNYRPYSLSIYESWAGEKTCRISFKNEDKVFSITIEPPVREGQDDN
jgi:hypothetical protein